MITPIKRNPPLRKGVDYYFFIRNYTKPLPKPVFRSFQLTKYDVPTNHYLMLVMSLSHIIYSFGCVMSFGTTYSSNCSSVNKPNSTAVSFNVALFS